MQQILCSVGVIACIFISSVLSQIVFDGEQNGKPVFNGQNPKSLEVFDYSENDPIDQRDLYDEIINHQVRDVEKQKRQEGCICLSHLKDPHCGSDLKLYDNGCYFECAQKRNPRLFLQNWGPCS